MGEKTRKTLEKQLELLSERSSDKKTSGNLVELSFAMVKVAELLMIQSYKPQSSSLPNEATAE